MQEWLTLPHLHFIHPAQTHFDTWSSLLREVGTAGNLTTDAHLAALAIERGLIHSANHRRGFRPFPEVEMEQPAEGGHE